LIADEMSLPTDEEEDLRIASYLHDIGKLGISSSIVSKPQKLSSEDWEIIKEHPQKGASLIESLRSSKRVLDWVRHHTNALTAMATPVG